MNNIGYIQPLSSVLRNQRFEGWTMLSMDFFRNIDKPNFHEFIVACVVFFAECLHPFINRRRCFLFKMRFLLLIEKLVGYAAAFQEEISSFVNSK